MAVQTGQAQDFIQSIGVAAHIDDTSSSYETSDVLGQMNYLGITNMRVEAPWDNLATYTALGEAGIKFDVITTNTSLRAQMGYIDSIAPYVKYVEGPNEVNTDPVTYNSLAGASAADAFQADLYNAIKSDPSLQNVSVLPFSLSVGGSLSGYGNVSAYANYGNIHGYAAGGVPPVYMLSYAASSVTTTPGLSDVMSETGYYTLDDGNSGVTQNVQATWLIDSLLENFANGVVDTYLYQLEDGGTDPVSDPENHYGLFNADGTPKESAVAIHNLTTILGDAGATEQTSSVTAPLINVTGLNQNYGFDEGFQQSDGTYDLALWSEPNFYSSATGVTSSVTPSAVTVSLGGVYDVAVYDPLLGSTPVSTEIGVTSVQVSLGTDPLIVEITPFLDTGASVPTTIPVVSTATSVPATIPGVSLGTGVESIVVDVSEDAWQGDAEFTLSVDGVQIGGIQSTTALQSLGQTQAFALNGDFATGSHTVVATFINDASGGSSTTDRNLYVDSIGSGGQMTAANDALMTDGSASNTVLVNETLGSSAAPVSLGSGSDSITVGVSEDAWDGDAQFTLSVDGVQIGGAQTATASHALGDSQLFTLNGDFDTGSHTVVATFLNDAYGGTSTTDRNLYVDSVGSGGQTTAVNDPLLWNASVSNTVLVNETSQSSTAPVSLDTGSESITVGVSEDAWDGDAQFTLSVDGVQIGGVQTATASHALGESQLFTLNGNFATGSHTVVATFLNDAYGGSSATDRNLYVGSVGSGGQTTAVNDQLLNNGSVSNTVLVNETVQSSTAPVSLGTGSDSITVGVSEDAWNGDAQFTLSVDGVQIGGVQTATASHALGNSQLFTLNGDFATGAHSVTATFLNDADGGSSTTDRNLYVDSVGSGGQMTAVSDPILYDASATNTVLVNETLSTGTAPVSLGSGSDSIAVGLSEDAWTGDAQFTLSVDGVQIGGVQTATASHALGQSQIFTLNGDFTSGSHTVTATFLNDAYGGSSTTDRNLYVDTISADGTTQAVNTPLLWNGSASFTVDTTDSTATSAINASTVGTGSASAPSFIASADPNNASGLIETRSTVGGTATLDLTSSMTTVVAGSGAAVFNLVAGTTGNTVIDGFTSGTDMLHLSGYTTTNPGAALSVVGSSTVLKLDSGTTITFANTVGLDKSIFL